MFSRGLFPIPIITLPPYDKSPILSVVLTHLINPGDVPRVDGQLAVARAFGDKSLKGHLSSDPDVVVEHIDDETEFAILASDGLWKVCLLPISRNTYITLETIHYMEIKII